MDSSPRRRFQLDLADIAIVMGTAAALYGLFRFSPWLMLAGAGGGLVWIGLRKG